MSKSLGTGIDPLKLIEEYGADATRFGIAYQVMGNQDMKFVVDNILMGKKFCNKIWNASRFILMNKPPRINADNLRGLTRIKNLTKADKKILKTLKETIKTANKDLGNFQFGKTAHTLYNFFWHDFCDKYIEESKKQNSKETKIILSYVLLASLKLLHPFIPFITEEIYQQLPIKNRKKSLMVEEWPRVDIR
jgi:valyl-tRNA synthetase